MTDGLCSCKMILRIAICSMSGQGRRGLDVEDPMFITHKNVAGEKGAGLKPTGVYHRRLERYCQLCLIAHVQRRCPRLTCRLHRPAHAAGASWGQVSLVFVGVTFHENRYHCCRGRRAQEAQPPRESTETLAIQGLINCRQTTGDYWDGRLLVSENLVCEASQTTAVGKDLLGPRDCYFQKVKTKQQIRSVYEALSPGSSLHANLKHQYGE